MGLFDKLMSKIFGSATSAAVAQPTASTSEAAVAAASVEAAPAGTPPAAPLVDVGQMLDGLAAKNSEKLDWKRSIVDLMKLVGIDSGLASRKDLANELGYTGDTQDSAAMNVWLHREVLKKLKQNGGQVPSELLD